MKRTLFKSGILLLFFSVLVHAVQAGRESGGGNVLNGKPLECYAKDIKKYEVFKTTIKAKLKIIQNALPGLAYDFEAIINDKTWYFVPIKLNNLPNEITGIHFNTDQTIIQKKNSVWINKIEFETLDLESQTILILHELVLGTKMLHAKEELNADDHDNIRAMTIYINNNNNFSSQDLHDELIDKNIFRYPRPIEVLKPETNSVYSFYNALSSAKINKTLPNEHQYHNSTFSRILEDVCVNRIHLNQDKTSFSVEISYRTVYSPTYIIDGHQKADHVSPPDEPTIFQVSQKPEVSVPAGNFLVYSSVEGDAEAFDGEFRRMLILSLDTWYDYFNAPTTFEIAWVVCSKTSSGKCNWRKPMDNELKTQGLNTSMIRYCKGRAAYDSDEIE